MPVFAIHSHGLMNTGAVDSLDSLDGVNGGGGDGVGGGGTINGIGGISLSFVQVCARAETSGNSSRHLSQV